MYQKTNHNTGNSQAPFSQQQLDLLPVAALIIYKEQVHSCNQAFTELYESTNAAHIIDQDILNFFPEQLPSGITAKQQQIQIAQQLTKQEKIVIESDLLSKNNNIIPVKINFSKNNFQSNYTVAIFEDLRQDQAYNIKPDIGHQKKAFQELAISEKKFKDTFEHAAIGISHISLDGYWLKVNNKICNILGYTEEELLDKNFKNITHPEDKTIDQDNLKDLILEKTNDYSIEKRYLHKNGEILWVNIGVSLAKNHQNEACYFICILEDISWRKKIIDELKHEKIKAELANSAKSTFLANMSHEIRTPMNAIIALTHLTLETELSKQQHSNLKKVQSAATLLLQIINDILDLSKAEAGKMSIQEKSISIAQIFNELQNLLQIKAQEKQLKLNFNTDNNIPEKLLGDATRISQILINLGSNAIKFTEQHGQITFSAYLNKVTEQQAELEFKVSDNGIGISKEQQNKLFDAFTQADESISRKYGGTGLGLAISKQLCEMMGGKIWVKSQLQQGSDFHFTISLPIDHTQTKLNYEEIITNTWPNESIAKQKNINNKKNSPPEKTLTLKSQFEHICLLLKNSDALAIEKLKQLHNGLGESSCTKELNLAIKAAINYDFDDALKELLKIKDSFAA